jgi:hypothetical protein
MSFFGLGMPATVTRIAVIRSVIDGQWTIKSAKTAGQAVGRAGLEPAAKGL